MRITKTAIFVALSFLAVLICPSPGFAQSTGISQGISAPTGNCAAGNLLYIDYSAGNSYICKISGTVGTWSIVGGGAGNPGGSSGQDQYNNAGVFGGYTLAGDCTITIPNISCTKTGGVAFAPSATTDTTIGSNILSGTINSARVPLAGTATALAANGTNCSAGQPALGVDASGNGEGCAAITDAQLSTSAITTNNATTSKHGFAPQGTGSATDCYLGTSVFGACPSGFVNPMTTPGDLIQGGTAGAAARLAVPTPPTGVSDFLCNNGTTNSMCVPGTPIDARTTATETIASSDRGSLVTLSNGSAIAVTLPQATGNFGNNFNVGICNIGAGTATITPTTSQVNGKTTLQLTTNRCAYLYGDNTNYFGSVTDYGDSQVRAVANGGTGTGSTLTGLVRGSASAMTAAELSGDVTTSGSNVATIAALAVTGAKIANNTITGTQLAASLALVTPQLGAATGLTSLATTTNCAAAGTAANPSVASCSAALSGSFSCATNASTGTCTVNTTVVTANSNIFVQPVAATAIGTKLSVTCNTTADTGLVAPRLAAQVAATSFTINLGTFSTNPVCFNYWIVN